MLFVRCDNERETPVPIPNTEVKTLDAENSVCEDRKQRLLFEIQDSKESFFVDKSKITLYNH
mgnify:CR=1 FL=1